jgi:hypothetical protein
MQAARAVSPASLPEGCGLIELVVLIVFTIQGELQIMSMVCLLCANTTIPFNNTSHSARMMKNSVHGPPTHKKPPDIAKAARVQSLGIEHVTNKVTATPKKHLFRCTGSFAALCQAQSTGCTGADSRICKGRGGA